MSIQAVAWALDQDLPARPKLVLVSIANHANHTDGYCWLKAETIAQEASCSVRAVWNFVGDLVRNGFIRRSPRRGDDGKQRSNDYWIMLARPNVPWVGRDRSDEEIETEVVAEGAETEPQDVAIPHASRAHGESDIPDPVAEASLPAGALGPCASTCTHTDSAEPSKIKPLEAPAPARTPRHYRPPPPEAPQPVGAVVGAQAELIFVYEGTPAWKAWKAVKERERGRPWNLTTTHNGRSGWYFPTLFPKGEKPPPDGDQTAHLSDEDRKELAKTG